jgi:hypothetical protein
VAAFSDPHSSHKVLYLSNMDLPGLPYWRNITLALDKGVLHEITLNR